MKWSKFKSSYMWGNTYHQRRRRFIVYQLAMILCVVSESLGTDVLSKYIDQQSDVKRVSAGNGSPATVKNDDLVGSFSYNIFAGVFVAFIFGAAFFFDLFWPERHEIPGVKIAWRVCSVLACTFVLSSALLLTVILSTHQARVVGSPGREIRDPPLVYKKNGEAIASLVLIWLGWLATVWATYLMWHSVSHIDKYGPFSRHARPTDVEKDQPNRAVNTTENKTSPEMDEEEKTRSDEASTAPGTEDEDLYQPPSIPTPAMPTPSVKAGHPPLMSRKTQD